MERTDEPQEGRCPRRNVIAVVVVVGLSVVCWRSSLSAKPRDEMLELYGSLVDSVEQVEANYVRSVPRKELLENALRGMLQNLDEHSMYLSENDWKQFQKEIGESYTGIGVSVSIDPETSRLKVLAPLVGAPAYVAGVMAGDTILEVDGHSTEGWTRDKAVEAAPGQARHIVEADRPASRGSAEDRDDDRAAGRHRAAERSGRLAEAG